MDELNGVSSYIDEPTRGRHPGFSARIGIFLQEQLFAEFDRWFLWLPVFYGFGIAIYFSLGSEPDIVFVASVGLAGVGLLLVMRRSFLGAVSGVAVLAVCFGFAGAKLRTEYTRAPVLLKKTGPVDVTGWIEKTDIRQPAGYRLTIRVQNIKGMPAERTPYRVRLTSRIKSYRPEIGSSVRFRAILMPPPGPALPGGFDFARRAWFSSLGAVGFVVSRPVVSENASSDGMAGLILGAIGKLRQTVDQRIKATLKGERGAVASALITGLRGNIDDAVMETIRQSGLAHVLAISGMHMALIAGSLFWFLRALFAAVPALSLRYPIKKWAAVFAIAGGAFYLVLSGSAISTQRAFMMITIMFLAVLLDRPALSLRNVALAALVILLFYPESLFDVSFQMSFAAVVALVSAFEWLGNRDRSGRPDRYKPGLWNRIVFFLSGILLTTTIASIATAPFAAYHFQQIAKFGLLGNLGAMPVISLLVMPMASVSLFAMPFGLEVLPLNLMALGIDWVLAIAGWISGFDVAVFHIGRYGQNGLILMVLGGLWLCLWRKNWRFAGIIVIAGGIMSASRGFRPDIYVDRELKTLAVRGDTGKLMIPTGRQGGYSLEKWMKSERRVNYVRDIDALGRMRCDELGCLAERRGHRIAFARRPAALDEDCLRADILIADFPLRRLKQRCPNVMTVIDRSDLKRSGAHAIYIEPRAIRVTTAAEFRGDRPWVRSHRNRSRNLTRSRIAVKAPFGVIVRSSRAASPAGGDTRWQNRQNQLPIPASKNDQ